MKNVAASTAMTGPSMTTELSFIAIVVGVAALFVYAVLKSTRRGGHPVHGPLLVLLVVMVLWLALPAILARQGILDQYAPPPAPGLVLIALITLGTIILAFSIIGSRLVA